MNADEAILAKLRAVDNLTVYDGYVPVDETGKVIAVTLPYLVYYASLGYDRDERMGGQCGGRVKSFQITGVGDSQEQAAAVLERGRAALSRRRVTVAEKTSGLILHRDSAEVRREDELTRPGGDPLFYGVERFEVGV